MITKVQDNFYTSMPTVMEVRTTAPLALYTYQVMGLLGYTNQTYHAMHTRYLELRRLHRVFVSSITQYDGIMHTPRQIIVRALPWRLIPDLLG